ncbi:MAG TPA: CRTAC1 family protein, partial [Myxococcota bacterium]|nr:CRTAC1 family protein [Myxococcota bacterium]
MRRSRSAGLDAVAAALAAFGLAAGAGCNDGADAARDATVRGMDAVPRGVDAASPTDAGVGPVDAGADGGTKIGDAGSVGADGGGGGGSDSGAADAGPPPDAGPRTCPPADAATLFVDCAIDRGVTHTAQLLPPFLVAGGVAVVDVDEDDDLDLFFTGATADSHLYLNDGTGRFTDGTLAAGLGGVTGVRGVGAADYDNDGDQDLYLGRLGPNYLFKNLGGGTFTEVGAAAGVDETGLTLGAVFGDYDQDGWLDIYTANYLEDKYSRGYPTYPGPPNNLYHNNADGTFTDVAPAVGVDSTGATLGVAFVDYDNDGDLDLVEVNDYGMGPGAEHNTIYRNDGVGGPGGWLFVNVGDGIGFDAGIFGMSACPGDYDNDGWMDVYAGNICRNVLHHNLGGTFEEVSTAAGITGYGFSDPTQFFTGWPSPDPMGNVFEQGMVEYLALYTDPTSTLLCTTSFSGGFQDFDNDGWLDFHLSNGYVRASPYLPEGRNEPDFVYHNEGDGTFTDVTAVSGADDRGEGRGSAYGDLDFDGDVDIVEVNNALDPPPEHMVLAFNEWAAGSWLQVKLEGVTSNRDGIGARVEIWADGLYQMRVVSGGDGSFSRSDLAVHFGLGA